jgi:hypothetical protein
MLTHSAESHAAQATTCVDSVHGFSFKVPPGWHIAPAGYELMDVEIYAAANNLDPTFFLPAQRRAARTPLGWPNDWAKTLKPGMVHFIIANEGGYGDFGPFEAESVDTFESALAKAHQRSGVRSVGDVDILTLRFKRWNRIWEAVAWMRWPYTARDSAQVMGLFESIEFRWARVTNQNEAICAAIERLRGPAQADEWPATVGRCGRYETRARVIPGGYFVQFVYFGTESSSEEQNRWAYQVNLDGSVREVAGEGPKRPLQPTAPHEGFRRQDVPGQPRSCAIPPRRASETQQAQALEPSS